MNSIDKSHLLCDRLNDEIGDSKDANSQGISVMIKKLEEIYGKEEEKDASKNYKEQDWVAFMSQPY